MDDHSLPSEPHPQPPAGTAAEAFARLDDRVASLDGRIALMVRAVEHMAAERLNIEIPDYTPTLEKTNAWLAAIIKRLKAIADRSEEHTSELQSLMRNSYAVFCLKKK